MHKDRHIRIRSVRRSPPDTKKLARVLIELARAQAETDALVADERQRRQAASSEATKDGDDVAEAS